METQSDYKYDVFISSKSENYPMAEEVYTFLTNNGLSVFLACKELQKIGESEYAYAIDKALDNSAHMIVVASELSYLESKWVYYEWSTFCNDLKSEFRLGNLLTILSDSIELKDLPPSLRHRQSFRFHSFKDSILDYLRSGKTISYQGEQTISYFQEDTDLLVQHSTHTIDEDINIDIIDDTTPILAFVGPHSVGKTTILYRLIRYLGVNGYTIEINKVFRPSYDTFYTKLCNDFLNLIVSNIAPPPTSVLRTMLCNISFHGITVFQAIDTSGDLFSSTINFQDDLPLSFLKLLGAPNPIIWLIVIDPLSHQLDETYKKTLSIIDKNRSKKDKYLIVLNKIETTDLFEKHNNVNKKSLSSYIGNYYPELTHLFLKNSRFPIRSQFDCSFIPFQTGNYKEDGHFVQSPDHFPAELFRNILLQSKDYLPGFIIFKLQKTIKNLFNR